MRQFKVMASTKVEVEKVMAAVKVEKVMAAGEDETVVR